MVKKHVFILHGMSLLWSMLMVKMLIFIMVIWMESLKKLDYIHNLGFNAIYLNPIFYSPSAHKFDTLDFFEVDEHLGGNEAFVRLMDEVHRRDMKLVLDVSIDHTSSDAKWFNRDAVYYPDSVGACNNPNVPEREFFIFAEDGSYESWAGVGTMPKLDFTSQKLRNIIYKSEESVVKKWLKTPYNIDGWRFDVADVMAHNKDYDLYYEVWPELYDEIKKTNPKAMILAEDLTDCSEMFLQNGFDSTMNYFGVTRPVREFLGEADLFSPKHPFLKNIPSKMTAAQLKNRINQFMSLMPYQIALQQFNLIDSHDVHRIYTHPDVVYDEYLGALNLLFALPGSPNVYYGDERLLSGRYGSVEGARFAMQFGDDLDDRAKDNLMRYKVLTNLKSTEAAFIEGGYKDLSSDAYTFCFARFSDAKTYIVIFSTDDNSSEVRINLAHLGFNTDVEICEVFGEEFERYLNDIELVIQVPPHKSYLLELK